MRPYKNLKIHESLTSNKIIIIPRILAVIFECFLPHDTQFLTEIHQWGENINSIFCRWFVYYLIYDNWSWKVVRRNSKVKLIPLKITIIAGLNSSTSWKTTNFGWTIFFAFFNCEQNDEGGKLVKGNACAWKNYYFDWCSVVCLNHMQIYSSVG